MTDVSINGASLYDSYGLILASKTIGDAEPQTSTVQVPGRNGRVDISDFIGVYYDNRTITMTFKVKDSNLYSGTRTDIEALSGTKARLIFSDEPTVFWSGRLTLESWERSTRNWCDVKMTMEADPFPSAVENTATTTSVEGENV